MRRVALFAVLLAAPLTGCVGGPAAPAVAPPSQPTIAAPEVAPPANPAIDGVSLPADRTIADDVAAAPSLARFARALTATGLDARLRGPGPFTVFAPDDEAWSRLQPGTGDALLAPENRDALTKLLLLHAVSGAVSGPALARLVAAGGGRAILTSLAGEPLAVTLTQGILTLTDRGGNRSYVAIADVQCANGTLHVVNGILVPRLD